MSVCVRDMRVLNRPMDETHTRLITAHCIQIEPILPVLPTDSGLLRGLIKV